MLEATPEEVDDKLAEVILKERRAEAAAAAKAAAQAEAEAAAQRQQRLAAKAAARADAAAAEEAEEDEEDFDEYEEEEEEDEEEEEEPEDPNDTTWSAPATVAPRERLSKPRLFADPAPQHDEGLDAEEEEEEEDDEVEALELAAAEAAAQAAVAKAARLKKKKTGGAAVDSVQSVLTAAVKGLSPELAAVMMRAVTETPSMRAAEAAVAAAQAAAAAAEAATVRIREQLGAPYPGLQGASTPPDEAARMRAETEVERLKMIRAVSVKERAAAAKAAKQAARDEELAGGREGGF